VKAFRSLRGKPTPRSGLRKQSRLRGINADYRDHRTGGIVLVTASCRNRRESQNPSAESRQSKTGVKNSSVSLHSGRRAHSKRVAIGGRTRRRQAPDRSWSVLPGRGDGAEVIPAQTQIESEPGFCVPVILHIKARLPEAEVRRLGFTCLLKSRPACLHEVLQIEQFALSEPEVSQSDVFW